MTRQAFLFSRFEIRDCLRISPLAYRLDGDGEMRALGVVHAVGRGGRMGGRWYVCVWV